MIQVWGAGVKPKRGKKRIKKIARKNLGSNTRKARLRSSSIAPLQECGPTLLVSNSRPTDRSANDRELISLPVLLVPRARRLRVNIPVMYRQGGDSSEWCPGRLENISKSGMALATHQLLSIGTSLEVVFEMPKTICEPPSGRILCRGYVARTEVVKAGDEVILGVIVCSSHQLHYHATSPHNMQSLNYLADADGAPETLDETAEFSPPKIRKNRVLE